MVPANEGGLTIQKRASIAKSDPAAAIPSVAIDDAIIRPGAVRINVRGAFIVEDNAATPQLQNEDAPVHDTGDIRLPHHTAVVSHVAVDVTPSLFLGNRLLLIDLDRLVDLSLNLSTFPVRNIPMSSAAGSVSSSTKLIRLSNAWSISSI